MKTSFAEFKRVIGVRPVRSRKRGSEKHFSIIAKWLKSPEAKRFEVELAEIKY